LGKEFTIPIVDFSSYLNGSPLERKECIKTVIDGFKTSGFLYLINSGIEKEQLDQVYRQSAAYFGLTLEEKAKAPNNKPNSNRGYSAMGREKATNVEDAEGLASLREEFPDIKETLEIGSEPGVDGDYPIKADVNIWPESLPDMKSCMTKFFKTCDDLHHSVLSAIAEGLDLDSNFFKTQVTEADHVLRLLHYPGVPKELLAKDGAVRAGAHTDYGSMSDLRL
jgi:isopenicillin N synthase-like dioxygenase